MGNCNILICSYPWWVSSLFCHFPIQAKKRRQDDAAVKNDKPSKSLKSNLSASLSGRGTPVRNGTKSPSNGFTPSVGERTISKLAQFSAPDTVSKPIIILLDVNTILPESVHFLCCSRPLHRLKMVEYSLIWQRNSSNLRRSEMLKDGGLMILTMIPKHSMSRMLFSTSKLR